MNDAGVAAMKRAGAINISVQNQFAREVTFQVPLAGFGKVYDGAPIDPAVLETAAEAASGTDAEAGRRDAQEAGEGGDPWPARLLRLLALPSPDRLYLQS